MVGVTKIQRGNVGYWLEAVAEGGEDYYSKPGEAPGEWVGSLAEEVGLSGEVHPAHYMAILNGEDPITGAQLVQRPEVTYRRRADGTEFKVEPVLGYDVRFSAPKSISLLYALGSERTRERVVAVMNEAVREGIAHLEQQACKVQRGKGGERIEPGEGFFGMAYRHRMSRAGDPALHVHVLISNLTRSRIDGKWLSLASPKTGSPLFHHGKTAGVIFQAALRAGMLREFGLEFEAVKNGYADLKGFSRELIEAFSIRSREIAEWMARHGATSAKAAQTAAYRTRDAKDHGVDVDARVEEWETRAEPFGFGRTEAEAMANQGASREPAAIGESAIGDALRKLETTHSHFHASQLIWALADQLPEGADRASLDAAFHQMFATGQILEIYGGTEIDPAVYTTPRVAETERRFIDAATAGVEADVAVVEPATVDAVLDRHDYLGADQREMVLRLTCGGEQVIAVAAWPGTGKTTALRAATEAWQEAGQPVIGCATARMATGELKDAGVEPYFSIASLLYQADRLHEEGRDLPEGTVILVDEANVTNSYDLEALRRLAVECRGKLVMIGDPRQLGAIGPGGLYAHFTRLVEPVRLTTIRRQRSEVDRRIVRLVYEGRGSEALDVLETEQKLVVGENLQEVLHALLVDWHRDFADGGDAVMIARRNRDVDYLNEQARELRRAQGKLGRLEMRVGETRVARGDRVQTRINSRRSDGPKVDNRERWDVVSVNPLLRTVKLRRVGGEPRTVKLGRSYLERITRKGEPALQHAYAITKFNAESKTFDRAYSLLDDATSLEQEVVAFSRGREIGKVYAVASSELIDPELGPARRKLTERLQDARAGIESEEADFPAREVGLREKVREMEPWKLAERRAELAAIANPVDPHAERREELEEEIAADLSIAEELAAEREALQSAPQTPELELDLDSLQAAERSTAERLRLNEAELESLPEPLRLAGLDSRQRLEAELIELRIMQLASREVESGRALKSEALYNALGPYPADPAERAAWGDGASAMSVYRLRYGITDPDAPLGATPTSPDAAAHHARAERRLEAAQRRLRHMQERAAERSAASELDISI
jgi:conjugative relaxase-like TrwC/TraI family protein